MKITLLVLLSVLLLAGGCAGPSAAERYPADTGKSIMVTNIVGGVTNIAPFGIGGLR